MVLNAATVPLGGKGYGASAPLAGFTHGVVEGAIHTLTPRNSSLTEHDQGHFEHSSDHWAEDLLSGKHSVDRVVF